MKYKILDTTDGKYENEILETEHVLTIGSDVVHRDVHYVVNSIVWISDTVVKIESSNYIAILKILTE